MVKVLLSVDDRLLRHIDRALAPAGSRAAPTLRNWPSAAPAADATDEVRAERDAR